jgi:enediyne biosynthesis protein E4
MTGQQRVFGHLAVLAVLAMLAACDTATDSATDTAVGSAVGTTADAGPSSSAAAVTESTRPDETASPPSTAASEESDAGSGPGTEVIEASVCWSSAPADGDGIGLVESTGAVGLIEPLTGMYGHAVAAGDVNGDGWTDLFVAGFADRPTEQYAVRGATGPSPDRLLLGGEDGFTLDSTFPGELARTSGATMADLDGDGDLDLVAVRNQRGDDGIKSRSTVVYEQVDGGWRVGEPLLDGVAGRSVAALDVDRDGLLDLLVVADRFGGGSTRLLRNDGDLRFSDVTDEWGIPDDVTGLALATVDLDLDGWSDIVVSGDPRVLMGGPDGFRVEVHEELRFELFGDEDDPAGIAVGDLNGNGRPDLVVGQHFNSTVDDGTRVPVRIFVNREVDGGFALDDVTDAAGSPGLETKSPHVAIVDLDNDGIPDIVTTAISSSDAPIVLRGLGPDPDGTPRFETVGRPGDGSYMVTGIEEDLDRDGRVDVFQVAWEPSEPSQLFSNTSASGHWLQIDLRGLPGGPDGARVDVLDAETETVLGRGWGASTTGYAAGPTSVVHVGLGDNIANDLVVRMVPADPSAATLQFPATADARLALGGC